ncbi:hypothetical protein F4778DRAFT_790076 [Xylariomycetidae sp. FL2044]|nr:hypothetical protein F4778DRAFT_790076 [Xylariomycetidae sp. FL2044]
MAVAGSDKQRSETSSTASPSDRALERYCVKPLPTLGAMSLSQGGLSSFADIAVNYRVYVLVDDLAEPQEIAHDWLRGQLYICQRYRQGNSFAPIETSQEMSVLDIGSRVVTSIINLQPYAGPHCLAMDGSCAYLDVHVDGGKVSVEPETRMVASFEPAERRRRARSSGSDFIAEVDLRTGKIRQRVNIPEGEKSATDGRHVAFSASAIRYAARLSSSGQPVVNVANDPAIEAIKAHYFGLQKIYVTSRNVMLV